MIGGFDHAPPPGNVAYNLSLTLDGQGLNYGPCRFYLSYYLRNLVLGGLTFKAMLDHAHNLSLAQISRQETLPVSNWHTNPHRSAGKDMSWAGIY